MIGRNFGCCEIIEKIAIGSLGTVYKAIDLELEVARVIKIFHPHLVNEEWFRPSFEKEMEVLIQLEHINIVRIINAIDDPDIIGFVMEYIEAKPLGHILTNTILTIQESLDIFIQVAKAIAYTHNLEEQMVHNNLSPDNIMLCANNMVKMIGLGIGNIIGCKIKTGIILGKPAYMAPEQFEGTVSIYTDQYTLGIILYEMVTGIVPFIAESPINLYKLHLAKDPISPRELNDQIPEFLENIILKSIAKDERDRFKSLNEMLSVLENKTTHLIAQADKAAKEKNFKEALRFIDQILFIEPDNKEVQEKYREIEELATEHYGQDFIEQWFDEAQTCYTEKLIKIGKAFFQQQKFTQALEKFNQALTIEPNNELINKLKALCEKKLKMLQIASYYRDGILALKDKDYKAALMFFNKVLELQPKHQEANKYKQKAEENIAQEKDELSDINKEYAEAKNLYEKGEFSIAIEKLTEILEQDKNYIDAKALLKKNEEIIYKNKTEEMGFFYNQGITFYKGQQWKKAIKCFNRVLKFLPHHKGALEHKKLAQEKIQQLYLEDLQTSDKQTLYEQKAEKDPPGSLLEIFGRDLVCQIEKCPPDIATDELERIIQILLRYSKNNALLVSNTAQQKIPLIEALAYKIKIQDLPKKLWQQRIIELSIAKMINYNNGKLSAKHINRTINEVKKVGNVILFITDFSLFIFNKDIDIFRLALLEEKFQCIVITTPYHFCTYIKNNKLMKELQVVGKSI